MTTQSPMRMFLRTFNDERGSLTALEPRDGVLDFEIRRIYYLHGITEGQTRGAHAHRELEQLIIAVHGRFELLLDNGTHQELFILDRPDEGLRIPRLHWRELRSFSEGAVALVLASQAYDESDYIRDYNEFLEVTSA